MANPESGRKPTFLLGFALLRNDAGRSGVQNRRNRTARGAVGGHGSRRSRGQGRRRAAVSCASRSTSPRASRTAIANWSRSRWAPFWMSRTWSRADATRSKSVPRAWNASSSSRRIIERFQGKKTKITLRDAIEGRRNWEGTLAGFEDGGQSRWKPAAGTHHAIPARPGGQGQSEVRVVDPPGESQSMKFERRTRALWKRSFSPSRF